MLKQNLLGIVVGAALLFTAIVGVWVLRPLGVSHAGQEPAIPRTGPQVDAHTYAGTGDPLRFRIKMSAPKYEPPVDNHTYAGTGDPLRFRIKPYVPNAVPPVDNHTYAGTGDPLRFRIKLYVPKPQVDNHTYAGTGDPLRYRVPQSPYPQTQPIAWNCFSTRFHAASDCDRITK